MKNILVSFDHQSKQKFYIENKFIFIIICISMFLIACNDYAEEKKVETELCGNYLLSIEQSSLPGYDNYFKRDSIIMTFKSNNEFFLNKQIPFLYDSKGRWCYKIHSEGSWGEISYGNIFGYTDQFSVLPDYKTIMLKYPRSKDMKKQVPFIVFIKISPVR